MPDRITLDVIDRPAGGLVGSLNQLGAIRDAKPPGMRALLPLGTGRFVTHPRPAPTPRRVGALIAWEDAEEVDEWWTATLGDLCGGAAEHWHVEAEVAGAKFSVPWRGWRPEIGDARPLDLDEPALIMISGELRPRYIPAFLHDSAGAVAHAFEHPAYLGGLALGTTPLDTTSCSCWRTYAEARDYAFNGGAHVDAVRRDRMRGHHKTDHFLRLRPLLERGTLDGGEPFGRGAAGSSYRGQVAISRPMKKGPSFAEGPFFCVASVETLRFGYAVAGEAALGALGALGPLRR